MFYVYMFLCYMLLKRGHISYIKTIFICDQHRIMINMVSSNVLSLKSSGFGPVSMLYHWASESSLISEAVCYFHTSVPLC